LNNYSEQYNSANLAKSLRLLASDELPNKSVINAPKKTPTIFIAKAHTQRIGSMISRLVYRHYVAIG
jgi:hypothetical protein